MLTDWPQHRVLRLERSRSWRAAPPCRLFGQHGVGAARHERQRKRNLSRMSVVAAARASSAAEPAADDSTTPCTRPALAGGPEPARGRCRDRPLGRSRRPAHMRSSTCRRHGHLGHFVLQVLRMPQILKRHEAEQDRHAGRRDRSRPAALEASRSYTGGVIRKFAPVASLRRAVPPHAAKSLRGRIDAGADDERGRSANRNPVVVAPSFSPRNTSISPSESTSQTPAAFG